MNTFTRFSQIAATAACIIGLTASGLAMAEDPATPEKCLSLNRIDRTEIIDENNIIFYMRGGGIFRNQLPHRCPGLRRDETIMYRPSTNRLCSLDMISVLKRFGFGFTEGPFCGLGEFYPVDELFVEKLKEQAEIKKHLKKKS